MTKLLDVAFEYKKNIKDNKEQLAIVGLEHLKSGELLLTDYEKGKDNTFSKSFKKGHILFGRRRAYLKKAAVAPFDGICSGDIIVIEANRDKIDERLLPFIIQNDKFFDFAISKSAGSLSPRVKWDNLKEFEFILPNKEKQKEYSDILWKIEDLKCRYKKVIEKTELLVKSQFVELTSKSKIKMPLKDLLDLEIENTKRMNKEIIYVEISSINPDSNTIENPSKINLMNAPDSAKQIIKKGDILVSCVRPNLKKIAINSMDDNVICTTGICVLRPKNYMFREYIKRIVLSDDFTNELIEKANGSTYPTVKKEIILNYLVPILSENEIMKLCDISSQLDKSKLVREECYV